MIRQGVFADCPVYWEIAVGDPQCIVLRPSDVGRITWRQLKAEKGEEFEAGGRLLVGVRRITAETAQELLDANPTLAARDGEQLYGIDTVRRLQQDVHVRVLEELEWQPGTATGRVFNLSPTKSVGV